MRQAIFRYQGAQIRAIVAAGAISSDAGLQSWNADHLRFRWSQLQKMNKLVLDGKITAAEWVDLMDAALLEGHANAWWIGRNFAGDDTDFNDDDLLVGRGFRDADADYLLNFYQDIKDGKYLDANGDPMFKKMHSRSRLYVGKMRGTTNEAFVDAAEDLAKFYWRLGGNEEHCNECPDYVGIFDGVGKGELFTTPGAGDTPCLGNCLCHIESVAVGVSRTGPLAVSLPFDDEDLNQIAA